MKRRDFAVTLLTLPAMLPLARAHHGWSSFDQDRVVYLEGKVIKSRWQNPHAELDLEVLPAMKLPADLAARPYPRQSADLDGKAIAAKATLPTRKDRVWEIELAPLTRMEAWKVAEIKPGANVSMLGFALSDPKAEAVLRVEYLFAGGRIYALRSSPS